MSTKSTRSSGTQHNQRGVTQGVTLVDPKTGLPVAVVLGADGKYRLAVDANVTANISGVDVSLEGVGPDGDNVYLVDNITGNKFKIEADGSINANIEVDAADGDNVAIRSSTTGNEIEPNIDGSINVNIIQSNGILKTLYNEVSSVANSVLTTIQTYTVPPATLAYLQKIVVSGTNIAEFTIELNSVLQDKKRTYFSGSLNLDFKFVETGTGLSLLAGDVITVKVIHNRPDVGDFNSRLQVVEV